MKNKQKHYIVKEYINYYIEENNLNEEEFCKLCNIEAKTLKMIENKDYNFDIDELIKISNFINIPMYKLLIGLDKVSREEAYFLIKNQQKGENF